MQKNRLKPVSLPLREDLQSTMNKIFPAALPSPNLYRIVAKNEALFKDLVESRFIGPTGLFDKKRIAPMTREKIILRTCVATRNDYEFALHEETISLKMGLSLEQIKDIQNPKPNPDFWEAKDLVLFELIDSLVLKIQVSDALFNEIAAFYEETELIEFIHIIGFYTGVAMLVAFAQPQFDNYKQYFAK